MQRKAVILSMNAKLHHSTLCTELHIPNSAAPQHAHVMVHDDPFLILYLCSMPSLEFVRRERLIFCAFLWRACCYIFVVFGSN